MRLEYREMAETDIPEVFAVRLSTDENRVTAEELEAEYGITPTSVAMAIRSHMRGWVCIADSAKIVGFAIGDASNGEVVVIAVLPAYIHKGIGNGLLGLVQEWLFDSGHDTVWLRSNPDPTTRAHRFYRRLGWRPTGEVVGSDEILSLTGSRSNG